MMRTVSPGGTVPRGRWSGGGPDPRFVEGATHGEAECRMIASVNVDCGSVLCRLHAKVNLRPS